MMMMVMMMMMMMMIFLPPPVFSTKIAHISAPSLGAIVMGIGIRALGLVAEKNLLKLLFTNKHVSLQVVHNHSGNAWVQASIDPQRRAASFPRTVAQHDGAVHPAPSHCVRVHGTALQTGARQYIARAAARHGAHGHSA